MKKKKKTGGIILDLILILISLTYILPIIMMISISFSSEQSIIDYGYSLFPKQFSTEAYRLAFRNPQQLIQSYKVTIGYTVLGTAACMVVQSLMAYPLSRRSFRYKKPMLVFLLITMFFNGGLIPFYLTVKNVGLENSLWSLIIPYLMTWEKW